jgi:hypothetical protein
MSPDSLDAVPEAYGNPAASLVGSFAAFPSMWTWIQATPQPAIDTSIRA